MSPKGSLTQRNPQMPQPHFESNDDSIPLAYLITFRCYGTWLHGDERGSVDLCHNVYGTPRLPPNNQRRRYEQGLLALPPVQLNSKQRAVVEKGIRETCRIRKCSFGHLTFVPIRSQGGDSQLSSLAGLECFEGKCDSQFERGGLLAQPAQSVGSPRQQETSLD